MPSGGSGGGEGQGAGSGGGSSGATPITLTPDSMVIPPGASTPVKYSEYVANYVPKSELATHQTQAVQNFLKSLVQARAKASGQRTPANQQHQQRQAQPADIFAEVKGLPLIDGQTLATLGERIQREGIAPLYQWAQQVNDYLKGINTTLQNTQRMTGSLTEERARAEFQNKMGSAVQALAKKVLPGVNLAEHPVINEFAQDVYLSYDPNDPKLDAEFPAILESRLDGIMKLAAAVNQAKLQQAREQRRSFLRPGGQAQPSGQGGAPRLSHRDIARNLFAASGNT